MAKKELPSPEVLRQLLRYEPETGKLFWRERPVDMFVSERLWRSWNTTFAGKEALTATHNGYLRGTILRKLYMAHRAVWAVYYGEWPQGEIDHINGVRSDNRLENLRDVSRLENNQNQAVRRDSKSGVCGVVFHKTAKKWQARITVKGQRLSLGYFHSKREAEASRKRAEMRYGFHVNHGRQNVRP